MEAKKRLTDFSGDPHLLCGLISLLDQAGLELWQSPECFWAIRLKSAVPLVPRTTKQSRRPRVLR